MYLRIPDRKVHCRENRVISLPLRGTRLIFSGDDFTEQLQDAGGDGEINQELLMKILQKPELAAMLKTLAQAIGYREKEQGREKPCFFFADFCGKKAGEWYNEFVEKSV